MVWVLDPIPTDDYLSDGGSLRAVTATKESNLQYQQLNCCLVNTQTSTECSG